MSEPVLQTVALSKSFGALKASREVSLELRAGEIHALIGPNGAGKSTLIQQIAGWLTPDSGKIVLRGQDVTRTGVAARARAGLGRTFQVSALAMQDSALQNAVLGAMQGAGHVPRLWGNALARGQVRDRAEAALQRVGLQDHAAMRVADLSHGQRRQLEMAIALTLSPVAFVMDEPMAGLGAEGSVDLTRLLDGLRAEAPILLVEHDMDAVFALADRISVLVDGAVIATGSVAEIRADAGVRRAYLGESVP